MKTILWNLIFFTLLISNSKAEVIIKYGTSEDLERIMNLDYKVTFEFFKPLYEKYYRHLPIGVNADYYLNIELKMDEESFPKYIQDRQLIIAQDEKRTSHICGLITFHNDGDQLEIDLLLVDESYRNNGIGKKLINKALTRFDKITQCVVYPLRFGNDKTLRFYESMGFRNLGVGPEEKVNAYGISYKDMHFSYKLIIKNQF